MSNTKIRKNQTIYCDMDGVLADFEGKRNAVVRFATEKGFFKKLKPIKPSVKAIKRLIESGYNVYILTASPNSQADSDKIKWVKKYLPQMPLEKVLIVRNGESKAKKVKTENAVLIDDYSMNLRAFKKQGGNVIKFINKRDNEYGKHNLLGYPFTKDLREIV